MTTFLLQTIRIYLQPLDVIDPKTTEFGKITQNNSHYAVQGYSRSSSLVR